MDSILGRGFVSAVRFWWMVLGDDSDLWFTIIITWKI